MANLKDSKRSHHSTSEDSIAVIDRISNLPDSLLSHILSFLPTKYAVGTSILSTRWKSLWTHITNLDFDDELYLNCEVIKPSESENKMFTHFVYRVLILLKSQRLNKVRIKSIHSHGDFHVKNWVLAAVERGVEELVLKINNLFGLVELIDMLPPKLFTLKTLRVLKIEGVFNFDLSSASVSLPSLKTLHLIRVYYENDVTVTKLFAGCPVLEDLVILRADLDGASTFNILSPSLKRLEICNDVDFNRETHWVLEINTPALEYLDLTDYRSWTFSLENMFSLVEAKVDVYIVNRPEDNIDVQFMDDVLDYDVAVSKLLQGLSDVRILSLSGLTMEALRCAPQFVAPKFQNLTRLKFSLESNRHDRIRPLGTLVANSGKLEEIIHEIDENMEEPSP